MEDVTNMQSLKYIAIISWTKLSLIKDEMETEKKKQTYWHVCM
jgi:hypothetical protein